MENTNNPANTEIGELERLKGEILTRREIFASYDFYMPNFETAVMGITDLELCKEVERITNKKECIFYKGDYEILETAKERFFIWKCFTEDGLNTTPFPEILIETIKNEISEAKEANPRNKPGASLGYINSVYGMNKTLSVYFKETLIKHFDGELNEQNLKTINPSIINDWRFVSAPKFQKEFVQGYELAHRESYFNKVVSLFNNGKTVTEIQVELELAEKREEALSKTVISTVAPMQLAEVAADTDSSKGSETLLSRIEWTGTGKELGGLINLLEEKGYIQLPANAKGRAELLRKHFLIKTGSGTEVTPETLRKYCGDERQTWLPGEMKIPHSGNAGKMK